MKGLQSPWGSRASICAHFHWTYKYLLWGVSWVNVQLFLADLPTVESSEKDGDTYQEVESKEDLENYIRTLM